LQYPSSKASLSWGWLAGGWIEDVVCVLYKFVEWYDGGLVWFLCCFSVSDPRPKSCARMGGYAGCRRWFDCNWSVDGAEAQSQLCSFFDGEDEAGPDDVERLLYKWLGVMSDMGWWEAVNDLLLPFRPLF
jgi:hypothetical protein